MPRIARTVAPGYPHHVTQRGNYQQPVFNDEDDFRQYLQWLQEYGNKYSLKIWTCWNLRYELMQEYTTMQAEAMARKLVEIKERNN